MNKATAKSSGSSSTRPDALHLGGDNAEVLVEHVGRNNPTVSKLTFQDPLARFRDRLSVRRLDDLALGGATGPVAEWELFEDQDSDYQDEVLPPEAPVLSVEAASSFGWSRWADDSVAIDHFGASAPGSVVLAEFGFTPDNVADRARQLLEIVEQD